MIRLRTITTVLLLATLATAAHAQPRRARQGGKFDGPNPLDEAKVEVYKQVGDAELKMYVFSPSGNDDGQPRPAIVFFFGGGWSGGEPRQFGHQCQYFASRGMVALAADYRVRTRHGVEVKDCVADAKSAMRWVRKNAKRLNIDPDRIVAAGGSAGGHLAAYMGTLDTLDDPTDDTSISPRPNAMILFNPAVDLTAKGAGDNNKEQRTADLHARLGVAPEDISPLYHVRSGTPPAIIFHGKEDQTVPVSQVLDFQKTMKEAGNRCELELYEGEQHGFFNYGRDGNKAFLATLKRADAFLTSLGYLSGQPAVEEFFNKDGSP